VPLCVLTSFACTRSGVADHLIDLGPEGGEAGGYIVAEGTPEQVAKVKASYTGQYLKKVLRAA